MKEELSSPRLIEITEQQRVLMNRIRDLTGMHIRQTPKVKQEIDDIIRQSAQLLHEKTEEEKKLRPPQSPWQEGQSPFRDDGTFDPDKLEWPL